MKRIVKTITLCFLILLNSSCGRLLMEEVVVDNNADYRVFVNYHQSGDEAIDVSQVLWYDYYYNDPRYLSKPHSSTKIQRWGRTWNDCPDPFRFVFFKVSDLKRLPKKWDEHTEFSIDCTIYQCSYKDLKRLNWRFEYPYSEEAMPGIIAREATYYEHDGRSSEVVCHDTE